jgi:hypothetical protein
MTAFTPGSLTLVGSDLDIIAYAEEEYVAFHADGLFG